MLRALVHKANHDGARFRRHANHGLERAELLIIELLNRDVLISEERVCTRCNFRLDLRHLFLRWVLDARKFLFEYRIELTDERSDLLRSRPVARSLRWCGCRCGRRRYGLLGIIDDARDRESEREN